MTQDVDILSPRAAALARRSARTSTSDFRSTPACARFAAV